MSCSRLITLKTYLIIIQKNVQPRIVVRQTSTFFNDLFSSAFKQTIFFRVILEHGNFWIRFISFIIKKTVSSFDIKIPDSAWSEVQIGKCYQLYIFDRKKIGKKILKFVLKGTDLISRKISRFCDDEIWTLIQPRSFLFMWKIFSSKTIWCNCFTECHLSNEWFAIINC